MHTDTNVSQKSIWIYVTDIETAIQLEIVAKTLNTEPAIIRWTVDTEDADNVLRVETNSLGEHQIPLTLEKHGLICTPMSD